MSAYWAGVTSALVGAVVGGVFTAAVALLRARSSRKTTELQLRVSYEHQIKLIREQQTQHAVREITEMLEEVNQFFREIGKDHWHGRLPTSRICTVDDLPARILTIGDELGRLDRLYGPFLPAKARSTVVEMSGLIGLSTGGWAKMAANSTPIFCAYGGNADVVATACDIAIMELQSIAGAQTSIRDLYEFDRQHPESNLGVRYMPRD